MSKFIFLLSFPNSEKGSRLKYHCMIIDDRSGIAVLRAELAEFVAEAKKCRKRETRDKQKSHRPGLALLSTFVHDCDDGSRY